MRTYIAANAWILSSFGGLVNATGRIGTGYYSDRIGRANAYIVNGAISATCLFLMPTIMASGDVLLLFLAVGVAYFGRRLVAEAVARARGSFDGLRLRAEDEGPARLSNSLGFRPCRDIPAIRARYSVRFIAMMMKLSSGLLPAMNTSANAESIAQQVVINSTRRRSQRSER